MEKVDPLLESHVEIVNPLLESYMENVDPGKEIDSGSLNLVS